MTVVAQPTPNPSAYKFTLEGHRFDAPQTIDAGSAAGTPFEGLFALSGVVSVFATADFVTIMKAPDASWDALLEPVRAHLAGAFT